MKILVTGGAGFIGSAFIRLLLTLGHYIVINLDKLTYAGNLENLASATNNARYRFVKGDICDAALVNSLVAEEMPDVIVNFAAESHVDRSILSPEQTFRTNLDGTFTLLEASRTCKIPLYIQISTDEVYGSVDHPHRADENYLLRPSSPYSASKAGADLLARSYFETFRTPVIVTRASNNYGPHQFPEKLIPVMISHALENRPLPIYGDGLQVRDWLYVDDHARAIIAVIEHGRPGEVYNVSANHVLTNLEVARKILAALGKPEDLLRMVKDRPGHDRRYALSSEKLTRETGWKPQAHFEEGLSATIRWYQNNDSWISSVKSRAEYKNYYRSNYEDRVV